MAALVVINTLSRRSRNRQLKSDGAPKDSTRADRADLADPGRVYYQWWQSHAAGEASRGIAAGAV
jgi:hypothetical protein